MAPITFLVWTVAAFFALDGLVFTAIAWGAGALGDSLGSQMAEGPPSPVAVVTPATGHRGRRTLKIPLRGADFGLFSPPNCKASPPRSRESAERVSAITGYLNDLVDDPPVA